MLVAPASPQNVDDRALGHSIARALRSHFLQAAVQVAQIGNLPPHFREVLQGDVPDLGAGVIATVDQAKQCTDLFYGESQLTASPDETQTLQVVPVIDPVATLRAWWRRHQADPLVIADGLEVDARAFGQLSDRIARRPLLVNSLHRNNPLNL
jgi:hypothetical protein